MEKLILIVHLLTALSIIGLILVQQGKGAEAGASFGSGASQTVFGSAGGWNFFSKITAIMATVFFVTSFTLAVMAKDNAKVGDKVLPELEAVQMEMLEEIQESDIPSIDEEIPSAPVSEIPEPAGTE
ncbi:MAG: preprotein translocase subunit SecG [Gammaproteobacteria bacterium]|nr:MAG: preprotein translocase subunit SecG [Gammaproteobacteria bacterium]